MGRLVRDTVMEVYIKPDGTRYLNVDDLLRWLRNDPLSAIVADTLETAVNGPSYDSPEEAGRHHA